MDTAQQLVTLTDRKDLSYSASMCAASDCHRRVSSNRFGDCKVGALTWIVWDTIIHFDLEVRIAVLLRPLWTILTYCTRWNVSGSELWVHSTF